MTMQRKHVLAATGFTAALCAYAALILVMELKYGSTGGGEGPRFVVTGIVRNGTTGEPITGARISDEGYGPKPHKGATTGATGLYRYLTWGEEHDVVAKAPGYEMQSRTLKTGVFQTSNGTVLDFALTPQTRRANEKEERNG